MKVTAWVATNKVGSKCEIEIDFDKEDWDEMTDSERDEVVYEAVINSGQFDWGYDVE